MFAFWAKKARDSYESFMKCRATTTIVVGMPLKRLLLWQKGKRFSDAILE